MKARAKSKTEPSARRQKRDAVREALGSNPNRSDHVIAKEAGTSHVTVGKVRRELPRYVRQETTGLDGVTRRRPLSGKLQDVVHAAKEFEAAIKRLPAITTLSDRENGRIKICLTDWIGKINTVAEPRIPPD